MSDNALALEVRKENLSEPEAISLQNSFMPFFQQAENMKEQALAINVTSVDQVDDIKKAREMRLTMKNIRVDCEKVRKSLKEESLRKGKAIDGMANVIKYLIAPIEEHLDNQEKFLERQEAQRIEKVRQERVAEMWKYQVDGNNFQNLGSMPDAQWDLLLNGLKVQFETAVEAAKKNEEDRKKREEEEAAERERVKKENEQRRIENEKLQEKLRLEKQKTEDERKKREEAEEKERIAKQKLKDTKTEIKQEKKAEAEAPRARAFAAGILQMDGEDIPRNAKAGDIAIFLHDTPENRHAMAHLMRP